ncbi:ribosome-binding factor A [Spiroplasma sabaudiense Ar-1343]|uniref:Ribosome-binding factor A n=1 Tax=Spiroplasma sabaudiense Ar-1343 TaxID=1276257 RepID=W6AJR7_9MOLU|nr:30S ribosome-binding factor RbfA [Spiroplasma sabaudiense]AHI53974.1 ribosome-binding factor A [Spiroplasma sabaudiense Ar-1343]
MGHDIKVERLNSSILRELSLIFQKEFHDNEVIRSLSVKEVRLTNDLSHAKVFYSHLMDSISKDEVIKEVQMNAKEIRHQLAGKIEVKFVPELEFIYDESLNNANKIEEILKNIKKN